MYSDETLSRNRDVSQVLSGLDNNGFSAGVLLETIQCYRL